MENQTNTNGYIIDLSQETGLGEAVYALNVVDNATEVTYTPADKDKNPLNKGRFQPVVSWPEHRTKPATLINLRALIANSIRKSIATANGNGEQIPTE